MLKLILVLILTLKCDQVLSKKPINKCCPENFVLDADSLICVSQENLELAPNNLTLIPNYLIDLSIEDFSKSLKKSDFQENDLNVGMGIHFSLLYND